MKFTLSWLKDYLDTEANLETICTTLTAIGLEVEQLTDPASALKDFVVAEIMDAAPHPNAAKLQVCSVSDGTDLRQIVCGAANARKGLKTVLAREGVFIPGSGITIKKTKIRDVESNGMLCSAEELALETESDGIIELPQDCVPGSPASVALGLDDPMIEINLTPNRADCLGVRGIARDLAAAGIGQLKSSTRTIVQGKYPSPISVSLETPHCPLFVGITLRNVKNGASPAWLQERLKAIGLKPISALVDITNYYAFTYARPLHVYDADKLRGHITVRTAKEGETLHALNDKEYALHPGMTVIADESGVLGLGGIIGGSATGCDAHTTHVFLEAAYFEPTNIAATGRALELQTDARYRFERGVDPAFVEPSAASAATMITELCGGEVSQLVIAGKTPSWQRSIAFNPMRIAALGGVGIPHDEVLRILTTLGCTVEEKDGILHVTPPSWRRDIEGEADLVEECLRIHGYAHIPATPLPKPAHVAKPAMNVMQKRVHLAKRTLASRGMVEICSWSFLPQAQAEMFGGGQAELKLINPISSELDAMRPSLLPNLLTAARNNDYRNAKHIHLFEAGQQFNGIAPADQQTVAAGVRAIRIPVENYHKKDEPFSKAEREPDAFDAKADALSVLEALGVNIASLTIARNAPAWYHPGRSGSIGLGGKIVLGYFGEIHPQMMQQFDLEGKKAAAFEIFLQAIPQAKAKGKAKAAPGYSNFQAVERDFAFVVKREVTAAELLRHVMLADKQLITHAEILTVYQGSGMGEQEKSVAIRATLQAPDRTLAEADITQVSQAIIASVAKGCGGTLRQ